MCAHVIDNNVEAVRMCYEKKYGLIKFIYSLTIHCMHHCMQSTKTLALWWTINSNFISTLHMLLQGWVGFWIAIISKSFECLDINSLPRLYKALVHPVIEYANSIWGPFYIGDQRMLEEVQKCATRIIPSLRDLPYSERLAHLRLPYLYYRRCGDVILDYTNCSMVCWMLTQLLFLLLPPILQLGVIYSYKLCKPRACKNVRLKIHFQTGW